MEVTKDDLNRLYDIIEPMRTDIAAIKTKLEIMPAPPKRPCQYHEALKVIVDSHIQSATQNVRDWKLMLIGLAGDLLKYAAIAAVGILLGKQLF